MKTIDFFFDLMTIIRETEIEVEDQEVSAVRANITDYLRLKNVAGGKGLERHLLSAAEQQANDRRNLRF